MKLQSIKTTRFLIKTIALIVFIIFIITSFYYGFLYFNLDKSSSNTGLKSVFAMPPTDLTTKQVANRAFYSIPKSDNVNKANFVFNKGMFEYAINISEKTIDRSNTCTSSTCSGGGLTDFDKNCIFNHKREAIKCGGRYFIEESSKYKRKDINTFDGFTFDENGLNVRQIYERGEFVALQGNYIFYWLYADEKNEAFYNKDYFDNKYKLYKYDMINNTDNLIVSAYNDNKYNIFYIDDDVIFAYICEDNQDVVYRWNFGDKVFKPAYFTNGRISKTIGKTVYVNESSENFVRSTFVNDVNNVNRTIIPSGIATENNTAIFQAVANTQTKGFDIEMQDVKTKKKSVVLNTDNSLTNMFCISDDVVDYLVLQHNDETYSFYKINKQSVEYLYKFDAKTLTFS